MSRTVAASDLMTMAGTDLGTSDWMTIDQRRIDAFAETTEDHQFIHVDPQAAAATPFGSTIAHGFLTLSLVVPLFYQLAVVPEGTAMSLNYGMDKLRFLAPVKVDSRIRLHASIADVVERSPGSYLIGHDVSVEIEGEQRPALVGRFLTLCVVGAPASS
jgi:acyl dehydratase